MEERKKVIYLSVQFDSPWNQTSPPELTKQRCLPPRTEVVEPLAVTQKEAHQTF